MIELGIYTNRRKQNYPDMTGFSKNFIIGGTGHDHGDYGILVNFIILTLYVYVPYNIINLFFYL